MITRQNRNIRNLSLNSNRQEDRQSTVSSGFLNKFKKLNVRSQYRERSQKSYFSRLDNEQMPISDSNGYIPIPAGVYDHFEKKQQIIQKFEEMQHYVNKISGIKKNIQKEKIKQTQQNSIQQFQQEYQYKQIPEKKKRKKRQKQCPVQDNLLNSKDQRDQILDGLTADEELKNILIQASQPISEFESSSSGSYVQVKRKNLIKNKQKLCLEKALKLIYKKYTDQIKEII